MSCQTRSGVKKDGLTLKREIGLWGCIAFVINTIIGVGIFISPQGVLLNAGSVGLSLIIWTLCGLYSLCGTFVILELGMLIPKFGGYYAFFNEAFGPFLGCVVVWLTACVVRPNAVAAQALTTTANLLSMIFINDCAIIPEYLYKIAALFIIATFTVINVYSVKLSNRLMITLTIIKSLPLVTIAVGGLVLLLQGKVGHLSDGFDGTDANVGSFALACYSGVFAYEGWHSVVAITEEIENPKRTMKISICVGISFVITLYMLANISYMAVLSREELIASPAVAVSWAQRVFPPLAYVLPLMVAVSSMGVIHSNLFGTARIVYAAGRNGHMMRVTSMIHTGRLTPLPASLVMPICCTFYIITMSMKQILNMLTFVRLSFHMLSAIAILVLRRKRPNAPRPFKTPMVCVIIMIVVPIFLQVTPVILHPQIELIYAFGIIGSLAALYLPLIHYSIIPAKFTEKITVYLQLLLEVCPSEKSSEDKNSEDCNMNAK